jgi:hypothetical protein
MTRAEVHAKAATELNVVVATEGTVAAVERGMRQGWVFWYVGSPVMVAADTFPLPSLRPFVFSAESHDAGEGRFVRCDKKEWTVDGLPDAK